MTKGIKKIIRQRWHNWIKQRNFTGNPQRLNARNLYILPSAFGWAYAIVLLTLFLCAVNYQVSAVFLLAFLLAIIGMISAWEAHFNLKGLSIKCIAIEDAQKGQPVKVSLLVEADQGMRYSLQCKTAMHNGLIKLEKLPAEGLQLTLPLTTSQRGVFELPILTFSSYFPLGLFRVWGYTSFDNLYYVYPAPVSPGFWPETWTESGTNAAFHVGGDEELYELKQVADPWVQSSRIAWKIAARGQGWFLKTMASPQGNYWLFRIDDLPDRDVETSLQHLSYWLQNAELEGHLYGLELRGNRTAFGRGSEHLSHCLRQLAIY